MRKSPIFFGLKTDFLTSAPIIPSLKTETGINPVVAMDYQNNVFSVIENNNLQPSESQYSTIITQNMGSDKIVFLSDKSLQTINSGSLFRSYNIYTDKFGQLIEKQDTNQLTHSSNVAGLGSQVINLTVTANSATDLEGNLTAAKFIPTTTNGVHDFRSSNPNVSNGIITISFFAKADELENMFVQTIGRDPTNTSNSGSTSFNMANGNIFTSTRMETYVTECANNWYYLESTQTHKTEFVDSSNIQVVYRLQNNTPTQVFAGNDSDGIYIWEPQYKRYMGSPIKTNGSAETRLADDVSISSDIKDLINDQFSVFVEFSVAHVDEEQCIFSAFANSENYSVIGIDSTGNAYCKTITNNVEDYVLDLGTVNNHTEYRIAFRNMNQNFSASMNGAAAVSNSSGNTSTYSAFYLGKNGDDNFRCPAIHIYKVGLYNDLLSDAELIGLTT